MDMLPEIKAAAPQAVVVIISAYGSEEKRKKRRTRRGFTVSLTSRLLRKGYWKL
jgi:hypothetical protein